MPLQPHFFCVAIPVVVDLLLRLGNNNIEIVVYAMVAIPVVVDLLLRLLVSVST